MTRTFPLIASRAETSNLAGIAGGSDGLVRLARVAELAFSNRLFEAESLISPGGTPKDPNELALIARIRVRQGRFAEGLKLWQQVLRLPSHKAKTEACIESLISYADADLKFRKLILIVFSADGDSQLAACSGSALGIC
jgi:hypothetical protein